MPCIYRSLSIATAALALTFATQARATLSQVDETGDLIPSGAPIAASGSLAFAITQGVEGLTIAAVANQDNGVLFLGTETFNGGSGLNQQLLAVSGFNSAVGSIRLHTYVPDLQRVPASVVVRSSTTAQTSLIAGNYETLLGAFPLTQFAFNTQSPAAAGETNATGTKYALLNVAAPAGTQSLFFDFAGSDVGTRITEVQAYAPALIPEPATAGLLLAGVGALLRRPRK